MSGEDQLIQIAIVSDDKKLAGALRALTGGMLCVYGQTVPLCPRF